MTSRLHSYTIKRTLRTAVTVLLALAGTVFLAVLFGRMFTIRNVIVDAPGMSIELDRSKFSYSLLFLPSEKLRGELLRRYSLLSDVRFEKQYPSTLVIHLTKRAPVAQLYSGNIWYALDPHSNVVDIGREKPGLPVLRMEAGAWGMGSVVKDPRVSAAMIFLTALEGSAAITEFDMQPNGSIRAIYGNTNILIPQTGDLKAKADTLQVIIEGVRIKGTLPTVIDLRFDKPIITN